MPHYRILGLRVCCNEVLPHTASVPVDGVDLHIELCGPGAGANGPVCVYDVERLVRSGPPALFMSIGSGGDGRCVRLRYADAHDHAEFVVGPGARHVWVTWSPGGRLQDVTTLLLGSVITCVLRLRGVLCLHAAVLELSGRAFALAGATGAGKSSTAAGLIRRGARLLADDVAAIACDASGLRVHGGPGSLRLHREVAEQVLCVEGPLPPLWSRAVSSKGFVDVARDAHSEVENGVPLAAVYVLAPRQATQPWIETISARESQPSLASLTSVRWVLDAAGRGDEFASLGRLASAVPVRRVHRPDALERLDDVCTAILEDMHGVAG